MEDKMKVYVSMDCKQLKAVVAYQRQILKGLGFAALVGGIYIYFSEKKRKELEKRVEQLEESM